MLHPASALVLLAFFAAATSYALAAEPPSCEPAEGIESLCGLERPEDLALYAQRYLIISQLGDLMTGTPGSLAVLDTADDRHWEIYPRGRRAGTAPGPWGDPACPGEPGATLSPHGLHLSEREDSKLQLLVVNHGGREAVEFFELLPAPDAEGPSALWRGCAQAPPKSYLNDTAALPGGGFLVTHMMTKRDTVIGRWLGMMGFTSPGHVWAWHPEEGFKEVPGTQGAMPNGISLAADGKAFFLNLSRDSLVRKVRLADGMLLGEAEVAGPDNSTWAPDGRLLVASLDFSLFSALSCIGDSKAPCLIAFEIVALDPQSMEKEVLISRKGPPMGAATVALAAGKHLYLGSFAGDRLLRIPYTP